TRESVHRPAAGQREELLPVSRATRGGHAEPRAAGPEPAPATTLAVLLAEGRVQGALGSPVGRFDRGTAGPCADRAPVRDGNPRRGVLRPRSSRSRPEPWDGARPRQGRQGTRGAGGRRRVGGHRRLSRRTGPRRWTALHESPWRTTYAAERAPDRRPAGKALRPGPPRHPAHASPYVRDAHVGRGCRPAPYPGAAGPCPADDDAALRARDLRAPDEGVRRGPPAGDVMPGVETGTGRRDAF